MEDWIRLAEERKWDDDNDDVAADDGDDDDYYYYYDDYYGDNNNLIQFLFINVSSLQPNGPFEKQHNIQTLVTKHNEKCTFATQTK